MSLSTTDKQYILDVILNATGSLGQGLRSEMREGFAVLDTKIDTVEMRLNKRMDSLEQQLTSSMQSMGQRMDRLEYLQQATLEAVSVTQAYVQKLPTRPEFQGVQHDVHIMKVAVRETNRELRGRHEHPPG